MSSAPVAALVLLLTLAAVLLVSGVAKLRDRRSTQDAFVALRVPSFVPAGPSAAALPWLEIALAVLLLVTPAPVAWAPAAAVLLLMLAYTALIARALRFDAPVSCSCFGSIGNHDVGPRTLGRNVLLSVLAGLVLSYAVVGGSGPRAIADLGAAGWWTLLACAAAVAAAVLIVGPPSDGSSAPTADPGLEQLDYERRPIPYGVLTYPDGRSSTLTELARTQARFLFFLNPYCGACLRIGEQLDEWGEGLSPAVDVIAVYLDESAAQQASHGPERSAWEPDMNLHRVLELTGTPSAVLLGADGLLAGGPVQGEDAITELVEAVLEQIEEPQSEQPQSEQPQSEQPVA